MWTWDSQASLRDPVVWTERNDLMDQGMPCSTHGKRMKQSRDENGQLKQNQCYLSTTQFPVSEQTRRLHFPASLANYVRGHMTGSWPIHKAVMSVTSRPNS